METFSVLALYDCRNVSNSKCLYSLYSLSPTKWSEPMPTCPVSYVNMSYHQFKLEFFCTWGLAISTI